MRKDPVGRIKPTVLASSSVKNFQKWQKAGALLRGSQDARDFTPLKIYTYQQYYYAKVRERLGNYSAFFEAFEMGDPTLADNNSFVLVKHGLSNTVLQYMDSNNESTVKIMKRYLSHTHQLVTISN